MRLSRSIFDFCEGEPANNAIHRGRHRKPACLTHHSLRARDGKRWFTQDERSTSTPEFLAKNANGRRSLFQLPGQTHLAESNAILYRLSHSSDLWSRMIADQAKVLQWMFFEQYCYESNIVTARFWTFIKTVAPSAPESALLGSKMKQGCAALGDIGNHLNGRGYFVREKPSVADLRSMHILMSPAKVVSAMKAIQREGYG
jgi:glutathione S-transferase